MPNILNFFKNLSPVEILLLVFFIALIFGNKILIRLARMAGETTKEIKKIKSSFSDITGSSKS